MPEAQIDHKLISYIKETMYEAGELSLFLRKKGIDIYKKPDNSPVSNSDIAISDYIYSRLSDVDFKAKIICEEKINLEKEINLNDDEFFWLVDPIDGTRSYIREEGSFTVNIALIQNKKPRLGFILQPTENTLYYTDENNLFQVERNKVISEMQGPSLKDDEYIAIVSSNHFNSKTKNYIENHNFAKIISIASSIKLCLVADGVADVFPKFGPTMEWDIAAGHALINASGGMIKDFNGEEITYAKQGFKNPDFLASGKRWKM